MPMAEILCCHEWTHLKYCDNIARYLNQCQPHLARFRSASWLTLNSTFFMWYFHTVSTPLRLVLGQMWYTISQHLRSIYVNIPVISFRTDVVQTTGFAKVRKSIPQLSGIQLPSYRAYCTHCYCCTHWNKWHCVAHFWCQLVHSIVRWSTYIKFLQDPLPQHIKQDIVKELNKTQSQQDTIDTVTVALGFLSCGTWNPSILLSWYIKTLKMDKQLSRYYDLWATVYSLMYIICRTVTLCIVSIPGWRTLQVGQYSLPLETTLCRTGLATGTWRKCVTSLCT